MTRKAARCPLDSRVCHDDDQGILLRTDVGDFVQKPARKNRLSDT